MAARARAPAVAATVVAAPPLEPFALALATAGAVAAPPPARLLPLAGGLADRAQPVRVGAEGAAEPGPGGVRVARAEAVGRAGPRLPVAVPPRRGTARDPVAAAAPPPAVGAVEDVATAVPHRQVKRRQPDGPMPSPWILTWRSPLPGPAARKNGLRPQRSRWRPRTDGVSVEKKGSAWMTPRPSLALRARSCPFRTTRSCGLDFSSKRMLSGCVSSCMSPCRRNTHSHGSVTPCLMSIL
mmetsp:Transcript_88596/g.251146  ORF Transcript_88596/g.251146 Transcript_88596/m.251146 type:complete len:240 (+) Transcript_88596:249-968(+)